MNKTLRETLEDWDFNHSRQRNKVYVDGRWHYECRCGETFLTMNEFANHRYEQGMIALGGSADTVEKIVELVENTSSVVKDTKGEITHYAITAENWSRIRTSLRKLS